MVHAGAVEEAAAAPSKSDVQDQLEKILASEDLRLPTRAQNFLRYVVEETLEGRSHYLKAYTIAETVFARRNFDAQNDPAVRIEACRIRRELERFYLLSRQPEPVLITIPKGGYVPSFATNPDFGVQIAAVATNPPPILVRRAEWLSGPSRQSAGLKGAFVGFSIIGIATISVIALQLASTPPVQKPAEVQAAPTIVVEPIDDAGGSGQAAEISRFLRDELVVKLVSGGKLTVMLQPAASGANGNERYLLQSSVRENEERLRLTARLVRQSDGAVLWSDSYDLNQRPDTSLGTEEAVADQIAHDIAQPLKIGSPLTLPTVSLSDKGDAKGSSGAHMSMPAGVEPQSLASNREKRTAMGGLSF